MQGLGIEVMCRAEVVEAQGEERLARIVLKDGTVLSCDILLVATGIRPNVELADEAGLCVERGIVVDELMRTSDPAIFAAGDAAELKGHVPGLWPTAVEQGRIAAFNALGAREGYSEPPPVTVLKVTGVDLMSAGRFEPEDGETVVAQEDAATNRYRKLVLSDGRIVGAILFGCPREAPGVAEAMKQGRDLGDDLAAIQAGDWSVFGAAPAPTSAGEPAPAWTPVEPARRGVGPRPQAQHAERAPADLEPPAPPSDLRPLPPEPISPELVLVSGGPAAHSSRTQTRESGS
jgi:NAD(P)H-nitrite reductase large subunit